MNFRCQLRKLYYKKFSFTQIFAKVVTNTHQQKYCHGKSGCSMRLICKVCTISFERPVNYLCDAWHVFPPKYEAWTHFNRPWTEYQCQGAVWTLLMIFTESVNRSTCVSVYPIIKRLRNVNLLCFSDSTEGIDFLNCTLKCLSLWNWPIEIAISTNCSSALFSSKETPI